jgi:hypothetical protein
MPSSIYPEIIAVSLDASKNGEPRSAKNTKRS